jgi:hypothetical protein
MKELTYYKNNSIPYKRREEFVKEIVNPVMETFVGTKKEIEDKESKLNIEASNAFHDYVNKRAEGESNLLKEFKHDLAIENGIENHPKLDKLWEKAWEHGHSSGLSEVKYWFEDLIELI